MATAVAACFIVVFNVGAATTNLTAEDDIATVANEPWVTINILENDDDGSPMPENLVKAIIIDDAPETAFYGSTTLHGQRRTYRMNLSSERILSLIVL